MRRDFNQNSWNLRHQHFLHRNTHAPFCCYSRCRAARIQTADDEPKYRYTSFPHAQPPSIILHSPFREGTCCPSGCIHMQAQALSPPKRRKLLIMTASWVTPGRDAQTLSPRRSTDGGRTQHARPARKHDSRAVLFR